MNVDVLSYTNQADRLVAATARGDYMEDSLVGVDLSDTDEYYEIINSVEHTEEDYEQAEKLNDPIYNSTHNPDNEAKTRAFIRDLIRKGHFGPFEHVQITFAIEGVSRACMAQLTRHRHASFDVQSMRYVDFDDADVVIPNSMMESDGVFASPSSDVSEPQIAGERYAEWCEHAINFYNQMVENGVPEEDARMVLPIGTKVHLTASFNLRSLMHVIDMRHAGDAQHEARELAGKLMDKAEEVAPISIGVYKEHAKGSSKKAP